MAIKVIHDHVGCIFYATTEDASGIISAPGGEGTKWDITAFGTSMDSDHCRQVLRIDRYFAPIKPMIVDSFGADKGPALVERLFEGATSFGGKVTQIAGYAIKSCITQRPDQFAHKFVFISSPTRLSEGDFRKLFEKPCIERCQKGPAYPSEREYVRSYHGLRQRILEQSV